MQQNLNKLSYLVGDSSVIEKMHNTPALPIFSDVVVDFLMDLSSLLLHSKEAKAYEDVMAYAFWIRKASIEAARKEYAHIDNRLGRGVAFQIAPSNIPVQFAVSMTYALVAGNVSIVRVSNKEFNQVNVICKAINDAINKSDNNISSYICIVRYEHDDSISRWFSENCDVRMIWGGDATVNMFRSMPIRPRAIEIGFADRYSMAIIDSDEYIKGNQDYIAEDFYIDTYLSDQNACSSSRIVFWTGNSIDDAKKIFWKKLQEVVEQRYTLNDISGSEKLLCIAVCAANHPGIRMINENNSIVRINLPELFSDIMDYKGNSGYFFEYSIDTIEELLPLFEKECQTITYYGEKLYGTLLELVMKSGARGVDRIVPMGHSMDLSYTWDGYDLPITLSRAISNR